MTQKTTVDDEDARVLLPLPVEERLIEPLQLG